MEATEMTTMIPNADHFPCFRARLELTGSRNTMIFMSGSFDGYELDGLRDRALYGVDAVRIDVDGVARGEAERCVESHLGDLARRGVKIYVAVN